MPRSSIYILYYSAACLFSFFEEFNLNFVTFKSAYIKHVNKIILQYTKYITIQNLNYNWGFYLFSASVQWSVENKDPKYVLNCFRIPNFILPISKINIWPIQFALWPNADRSLWCANNHDSRATLGHLPLDQHVPAPHLFCPFTPSDLPQNSATHETNSLSSHVMAFLLKVP